MAYLLYRLLLGYLDLWGIIKMKNKKASLVMSPGITIRIIAGIIDVVSLPFLILNPSNPFAMVAFGFGNFLLLLGGLID